MGNRLRVVHLRKEPYDVYIGRPSKWENPIILGRDGNRKEVLIKYRKWIKTQTNLLRDIWELEGKVLGCWCHPKLCHGDVLVELVNEYRYNQFLI